MPTLVYGASDDLIEFEGDLDGEAPAYFTGDRDSIGALVAFSDGTVLSIRYGKPGMGVWAITLLVAGALFDRIETCHDEDAERYSDVAYFRDGKIRAWVGQRAEVVQ